MDDDHPPILTAAGLDLAHDTGSGRAAAVVVLKVATLARSDTAIAVGRTVFPYSLYAPTLSGPDLHERLVEDHSTRRVPELWRSARCALVGVGVRADPLVDKRADAASQAQHLGGEQRIEIEVVVRQVASRVPPVGRN